MRHAFWVFDRAEGMLKKHRRCVNPPPNTSHTQTAPRPASLLEYPVFVYLTRTFTTWTWATIIPLWLAWALALLPAPLARVCPAQLPSSLLQTSFGLLCSSLPPLKDAVDSGLFQSQCCGIGTRSIRASSQSRGMCVRKAALRVQSSASSSSVSR